jgi:hypothetical protein
MSKSHIHLPPKIKVRFPLLSIFIQNYNNNNNKKTILTVYFFIINVPPLSKIEKVIFHYHKL